jgi:2-phosphoglycerate kinase
MSASESKVFWLGGSPCAGKTSISEILAKRFGLDVYHVDEAFDLHLQHIDDARHPALMKWRQSSWNQRWMQPIDDLVQDVIGCYREHFDLFYEDILKMARDNNLLVEGSALLPRKVASVSLQRERSIWLIPSAEFQREHYSERDWAGGIMAQCDEPEVAFHNWMERDVRFARWVETEANALNFAILRVDGKRTLEETAASVAAHFELAVHQW